MAVHSQQHFDLKFHASVVDMHRQVRLWNRIENALPRGKPVPLLEFPQPSSLIPAFGLRTGICRAAIS